MTAPEAIKQLRKSAQISQGRLARNLGVAPSTVARWEQGVHEPEAIQYARMAEMSAAMSQSALAEFFQACAGGGEIALAAPDVRRLAEAIAAPIVAELRDVKARLAALERRIGGGEAPPAAGVTVRRGPKV